ncbi:MFS transporter [Streptomyces sp. NPDC060184]|uniref:MFS transporter n=1 Tax=Streptomyces sp. NPDC060184 TaxID=3347064 RepID=UPI00365E9CB0
MARAAGDRGTRALAVLGLSAFVVGTAEFAVVGVLDKMAKSLQVGSATAGLLVTAYALGVCLGGPLLTAATLRLPRRLLLCAALGAYAAANALTSVLTGFTAVFLVRAFGGAVHGLFVGVACATAASLVPAERKGRAVAVVFGGIAVANLLGVPLTTYVGHVLPWQHAFLAIAVLACAALLLVRAVVPPAGADDGPRSSPAKQFRHIARAPVLALLATAVLVFCGMFTAFTQLSGYLQEVVGVQGGAVSVYLLVFGAAGSVGTAVGGYFADRAAGPTVVVATAVLAAALTVLHQLGPRPVGAGICVALWGLAGFGLAPALQLRTIRRAGPGGDLAATLGASAGNAGIAAGAAVAGGVTATHGFSALPLAAAAICVLTLPLTWLSRHDAKPLAPERPEAVDLAAGHPATGRPVPRHPAPESPSSGFPAPTAPR